jgi:DNA-binding PadR family transcriptional regulator
MSLTHALLGILSREPLHGYDIRQRFGQSLGGEWSISFGQLYPALGRLEVAGLVEKSSEPSERASGKHVYSITPAGRATLAEWLASPCGCQVRIKDDLTLRLALFDMVPRPDQVAYLEQYRADTTEKRASLAASIPGMSDPWLLAIAHRGVAACDAELEWLDGMLAHARRP